MKQSATKKQDAPTKPIGKIVTFYSFKGGSGRSMSLANLAVLFSKQNGGRKVLMMDWDLEAPGLHEFFKGRINETELHEKEGVIELFEAAKQKFPSGLPEDSTGLKKATTLIEKHFEKNVIRLQTSEHLEMLQAGKPDPDYAASVQKFDWRDFFDTRYIFFTALVQFLKSRWDYILIDSRTGLTDTGGICTAILPEALVTVFTPTRQGLKVTEMIERAINFRKGAGDMRPLVVYPLVSRVDASEEDRNREWKEIYTPLFQDLFKRLYDLPKCDLKRYFGKVEIHYVRKFAYGEMTSTLEPYDLQNRFELPARYNELAQIIIGGYLPWEAPDLPDIPMTDANRVGYYAVELQNNEEYKRAEIYFQKAIEMNPKNLQNLTNYISFLHTIKNDYEGAETYYQKALEAEPNNADYLSNYAFFLENIKQDYKGAEDYYLKALESKSDNTHHLRNYAFFLENIKKDYEGADAHYRKAIEAEPNNADYLSNYAFFLENVKKDYEGANAHYRKAIEAEPNNADYLSNYAFFLENVKKDYQGADAHYQKALEAEPNNVNYLAQYAFFLENIKKDYQGAEICYWKLLKTFPTNAVYMLNYALFIEKIKNKYEGVEDFYQKLIKKYPTKIEYLRNYAFFLRNVKKDQKGAEFYFWKALEAEPNDANYTSNYAWFLHYIKKDYEGAEAYYRKVLEADPNDAINLSNYTQLLFWLHRNSEAEEKLNQAFFLSLDHQLVLPFLWFYRYAHLPAWREQALQELQKLLSEGVRTPNWNFEPDIELATKAGHPDPAMLRKIADELTQTAGA